MSEFFKIFKSEKYGQILVINDTNDEGMPSVQIKFNIPSKLGTCSINAAFADSREGFDSASYLFETSTKEKVIKLIAKTLSSVRESRVHH